MITLFLFWIIVIDYYILVPYCFSRFFELKCTKWINYGLQYSYSGDLITVFTKNYGNYHYEKILAKFVKIQNGLFKIQNS
ncbi:hypothetical protein BpHYR1_010149 [Brachionus plicatilis]|uniref:Uncharacterized protein n=1 Tax=Brachionus plicatilis TaxID=10195 RepID=A0A3M7PU05_BRAPC|nr:hypothetical protein BpHYR1_010149 [Brachionus plicatilis]